jgi:hypothetical protein
MDWKISEKIIWNILLKLRWGKIRIRDNFKKIIKRKEKDLKELLMRFI